MSQTSVREFIDRSVDPNVVGFLHTSEAPNGSGLVLTHGAGGNAQAPILRALAEEFAASGYTVLRCNLPYRQLRSFGPPGPGDAARDRAGLKNAIAVIRKLISEKDDEYALEPALSLPKGLAEVARGGNESKQAAKIFIGGHSYGGRQSSMLCAEEPDLVSGLLLLSYPLHPPRKPEQQRTQHLPDLQTPTLFVSGTRDPFGSIEELQRAIKMIPAKTSLLTIEGAGHDLGFKGKGSNQELVSRIVGAFTGLFVS